MIYKNYYIYLNLVKGLHFCQTYKQVVGNYIRQLRKEDFVLRD